MTRRRGVGRLGIVGLLVVVLGLTGAGTALAHNSLISSDPGDKTSVTAGPSTVTLTFSDVVQNLQPVVTVVGPAGDRWEGSPVSVRNNTVTVPVNTLGPAGTYTIAYRIISADGHPVEGITTFDLTAAGGGTPNPAGPDDGVASNDIPSWVWIVGAALVLVVVVLAGVVANRRRSTQG